MESSIAEFLVRQLACELLPTINVELSVDMSSKQKGLVQTCTGLEHAGKKKICWMTY